MKIKLLVWWRYKIARGPHGTFETEGPVIYDDASGTLTFPDGDTGRVLEHGGIERMEIHLEQ